MVFASLSFLYLFLPLTLLLYYVAPRNYRNTVLLLCSYLFYLWGSGAYLLLLILSTVVDYAIGVALRGRSHRDAHILVSLSIFFNLGLLVYFKYAYFVVTEINRALAVVHLPPMVFADVLLPLGISFFTFQKITYMVDVYRGTRRAFTNFIDYALYIALFPQLIAGPIVRFHEISEQLRSRTETMEKFYRGGMRFCWGFIKKVLLADGCGEIANAVFGYHGQLDTTTAWLGVFSYTLQIYLDFSAYSDMAIGLGLMFGLTFPENFNRPYSAVSITDFWRRWHMTLTNFFREYVYFPLGGNRRGPFRTYANLTTVFLLCGLWHGASWNFILWGAYHGALLIIERITGLNAPTAGASAVRRAGTFVLVMVGWVLFRAADLEQAGAFLTVMLWPTPHVVLLDWLDQINARTLTVLALSSLVIVLPRHFTADRWLPAVMQTRGAWVVACFTGLMIYATSFLVSNSYSPFLYFRF